MHDVSLAFHLFFITLKCKILVTVYFTLKSKVLVVKFAITCEYDVDTPNTRRDQCVTILRKGTPIC